MNLILNLEIIKKSIVVFYFTYLKRIFLEFRHNP